MKSEEDTRIESAVCSARYVGNEMVMSTVILMLGGGKGTALAAARWEVPFQCRKGAALWQWQ